MTGAPDILVRNARIVTMDDRIATAAAAAVRDGRFSWVGLDEESPAPVPGQTRVVDCRGGTVVPGFVDAHCHVLAYAASLLAVDCRPPTVGSIADLVRAVRQRAATTPPGSWIRAAGYSEWDLAERHHPTRWDLDAAAPEHPVRLNHRSGHASVLNSSALKQTGIGHATNEPPGGVIDRDPETGEPTGLLLEMDAYLQDRIPALTDEEMEKGIREADRKLLSAGITTVQDAGSNNTLARWETFRRIKSEGWLSPRMTMMAGARHLDTFRDRGLGHGAGDEHLRVGPAKIMLTATAGALTPERVELHEMIAEAAASRYPVAVHAVEAEAVTAAADALVATERPQPGEASMRHRIEHCSECPDGVLKTLGPSGITVVTNPGFIFESGSRYLAMTSETMLPNLYRIRSLLDAGVMVAAGSDAPVAEPAPLLSMYAAVTRRARAGESLVEDEAVSLDEALAMHTRSAAYAGGLEAEVGSIAPGRYADFAVLDRDIYNAKPEELLDVKVVLTVIGGQVMWEGASAGN